MPITTAGDFFRQDHRIVDHTEEGKCVQCGQCCTNFLPMSKYEVRKIHEYIKTHGLKERRHIIPMKNAPTDWTCPFLNDDRPDQKCTIYEVRPEVCRAFTCHDAQAAARQIRGKLDRREVVNARKEFFS